MDSYFHVLHTLVQGSFIALSLAGKRGEKKKKKHLLFSDHVFLHSTNSCHGFNSLYAPETLGTVI